MLYRRGSGNDCKSFVFRLGWFDSITSHKMKTIITTIMLFLTINLWGQYSGITYFPTEGSFMVSMENSDGNGWGIHAGGGYNMFIVTNPVNSMNPNPYLDRFGINYGILKSGIVIGTGIKFNTLPNTDKDLRPEVWVKLHPLKLITQNRNQWDVSVTYSISEKRYWGFGLAIPLQFRYNTIF